VPLSLRQILTGTTEAQVLRFLLDTLESLGFTTTSWQDGSVQRNILTAVARLGELGSIQLQEIAEKALTNPQGAWLDLVGLYRFNCARLSAIETERTLQLTLASSASPTVVLEESYFATTEGVRFRATEEVSLNPGESKPIDMIAEIAGIIGNVPNSTTITPQTPAYSGLTSVFSGAPSVIGVDIESDTRYWTRLQLRWSELTYSIGLRAYEYWALTEIASLNRAKAINNYPGQSEIYIALDSGEASEITAMETIVAARRPPNDDVTVAAANNVGQTIEYTPRIYAGTTITQMNLAIQAMLDAMPIGGDMIAGASAGRLLREKINQVLLCTVGAYTSGLITPATDIVLGATDTVTGTFDCTPETVI
jgi:uncharacterized phage protein gp47/JayE